MALDDQTKREIQKAYSEFLSSKELKPRYGQKLMIAEVARTLGNVEYDGEGVRVDGQHIAVIEAGTGTGKTIGYLLPTIAIAKKQNKTVVLATATVALQEQIIFKDLPELIRHSPLDFQFRLAKGRGRYLCLSKLDSILSHGDETDLIPLYEDETPYISDYDVQLYGSMMDQLSSGKWDGDRDNWEDEVDRSAWQRVTTDHRQCSGRKCSNVRQCSFFKARDSITEADCIVANHDLVLADLALGGGAILPAPENSIYVFDEGHHLPDKALNHFSCNSRIRGVIRWLGQSEGQWKKIVEPILDATYFMQLAEPLESTLKAARSILEGFLPLLEIIMQDADYTQPKVQYRFVQGVVPEEMEQVADQLADSFSELSQILNKMHRELGDLMEEPNSAVPLVDLENIFPVVGSWLLRAENNQALWQSYRDTKYNEKWPIARWVSVIQFNDVTDYEIVSSPIMASKALEKGLWQRCAGAVVTSATITALNSFDRFKQRSGTFDHATYSIVPSPFDFQKNAVLTVPSAAIEANNAAAHTDSIIQLLPEIVDKKAGTLALFSSRKQMTEVFEALPLSWKNQILVQGNESKQALIRKHKEHIDKGRGNIIFGLASFAEGVDLPGDYCTHVIIAKIPFSVPNEPIEAALAEWVESTGGNSFMQISVPDAAMRLVQACGRLLRTESDQGKITILDKRLVTKRYGSALINSLPDFRKDL